MWNDLSMSEKNSLIQLYIKNGVTSLDKMKEHYNSFADGGRLTLQQWKSKMQSKYPDIEMDNDKAGYDYDSYFNDNYDAAVRQLSDLRHFPDTYKLPNHRTFSNESMYSRGPMIGGQWTNAPISNKSPFTTERFTPSNVNRQYYPDIYKENRPYSEGEIYHSFASGGFMQSPDWDPEHKHIHTQDGKKIILDESTNNVNDPLNKEILELTKLEELANIHYSDMDNDEYKYERNPEYDKAIEVLRSRAYGNQGALAVNYWDAQNQKWGPTPLPQGYTRDEYGVITDSEGRYYTPYREIVNGKPNTVHRGDLNNGFYNTERNGFGYDYDQFYERVELPSKYLYDKPIKPKPADYILSYSDKPETWYYTNPKVYSDENKNGINPVKDTYQYFDHETGTLKTHNANSPEPNLTRSIQSKVPYDLTLPLYKQYKELEEAGYSDLIFKGSAKLPVGLTLTDINKHIILANGVGVADKTYNAGLEIRHPDKVDKMRNAFLKKGVLVPEFNLLNKLNGFDNSYAQGSHLFSPGGNLGHITWGGPVGIDSSLAGSAATAPKPMREIVRNYNEEMARSRGNSYTGNKGDEVRRKRLNDTPTAQQSQDLEDAIHKAVYNSVEYNSPKYDYTIPYIYDKEIKINGHRTSENVLDTLYKYSQETGLPFVDALGLAGQETGYGSMPVLNIIPENLGLDLDTGLTAKEENRILANTNYFRNYGSIPANNLVRDFAWENTDMSQHPLIHAFNYFKQGKYNPKDPNHTSDVRRTGQKALESKAVREWAKRKGITFDNGGHLFGPGGNLDEPDNPPVKTYNIPTLQPIISVADNTQYKVSPTSQEIEESKKAYEAAQIREALAKRTTPVLKADTRTKAEIDMIAKQRQQAEYNRSINEAVSSTMSVGRPNTESSQATVLAMPYVIEAAKNYDPTNEIKNAMYLMPGISNVMMAQDARTAFDNNQTGAGIVNAAFALAPMLGVTPNFKSPLRYTRPANRVGDWTILDYGRNTTTTPVQSSTTPMFSMPNTLRLSSVERPSLSTRPTQGRIGTTNRLQLPEMTESFRALEEAAYQQYLEDLYNNAGGLNADELFEELEALREQEPVNIQTQAPHAPGITEAQAQELRDLAGVPLDPGFEFGLEDAPLLGHNPLGPNPEPEKLGNLIPSTLNIRPQIKPLIKGAEIEKQLSKTGTISRKSLDAYIAKQGKYYQDVMNETLESEFKGVDKIDYVAFQDAVQKRLPEYNRIKKTNYEDYGLSRIGFKEKSFSDAFDDPRLEHFVQDDMDMFRWRNTGELFEGNNRLNWYKENIPELNTFTFETPGIAGNTLHYSGNPIGHSRTYTTTTEPEILHVMESQSDWAQHPTEAHNIEKLKQREARQRASIEELETALKDNKFPNGMTIEYDYQRDMINEDIARYKQDLDETLRYLDQAKRPTLYKQMIDTYTERQIQENLRYAAEQGQTKMRYPTRETAAKIEGYSGTPYGEYYDVKKELDEVNGTLYGMTHLPEPPRDITGRNTGEELSEATRVRQRIAEIMESDMYKQTAKKAAELRKKLREVQDKKYIKYSPQHETILKKYDAFPKQFQKLFGKKAEVRTVTDSKGNTWYEVNVPESYKDETGQIIFATGGLLSLGTANNSSSID